MGERRFDNRSERELIELWLLANEGLADAEQLEHLSARLQDDAAARQLVLALASHQGWLAWQGGPAPCLTTSSGNDESIGGDDGAPMENSSRDQAPATLPISWPAMSWPNRTQRWAASVARTPLFSLRGAALVAGIALALVWLMPQGVPQLAATADLDLLDARLVGGTLCVWGPNGAQRAEPDGRLHEGDSLQLLEGIAELSLEHRTALAKLLMEGPAAVVVARQAVPNLRYGKITVATMDMTADRFPVETPFGRVSIEPGSEIGISAFGGSAQVHVFTGVATVESPWLVSPGHESVSKLVGPGEALVFEGVGDVALRVKAGVASRARFTPQVSMQSDFLAVGHEYVHEIRRAAPLAYWRFEGDSSPAKDLEGLALNEMGDRFHGRLRGKVRWVGPEGNQAIEFGVTPEPGSLVVDESWDEVLDGDFTLEAWIKPSHYHLGSIMGFIGEFDWEDGRNKHGILLEVGGTSQPSAIHQPERIRFLHRSTLGVQGGVSCFSDEHYQPRRWQHVVAVREGTELRLYLNGILAASKTDDAPMALGLQLVMGQLYSESVERFFIGHVDEVAIYDRAIAENEIRRHHKILRPAHSPREEDSTGPTGDLSISRLF